MKLSELKDKVDEVTRDVYKLSDEVAAGIEHDTHFDMKYMSGNIQQLINDMQDIQRDLVMDMMNYLTKYADEVVDSNSQQWINDDLDYGGMQARHAYIFYRSKVWTVQKLLKQLNKA